MSKEHKFSFKKFAKGVVNIVERPSAIVVPPSKKNLKVISVKHYVRGFLIDWLDKVLMAAGLEQDEIDRIINTAFKKKDLRGYYLFNSQEGEAEAQDEMAKSFIQQIDRRKNLGHQKLGLVLDTLYNMGEIDQEEVKYNEELFPFTNEEFASVVEYLTKLDNPYAADDQREEWIFEHDGDKFKAIVWLGQGSSYTLTNQLSKLELHRPAIKVTYDE
jgi:hypothetical protein